MLGHLLYRAGCAEHSVIPIAGKGPVTRMMPYRNRENPAQVSMTKIESLRTALEADDYARMAGIIRRLDWERDADARCQLAEWIESGELVFIQENGAGKLRRRGYAT